MSFKRVTGLGALAVGIVMIVFSLYVKGKIAAAKNTVDKVTGHFSDQPAGKMFGGMMDAKAEEYNVLVGWFLTGGIVFVVAGGTILYLNRKKKR